MAESFGEKTEAPTPKRKQKAREDGNVLKSRDFAAALVVLAGCGWMAAMGPAMLSACREVMRASFTFGRADVEHFEPWRALAEAGWKLAPSLGSLLVLVLVAAIASQAGIGALTWNGKLIAPKASRINPASGLKRIFGPNGWIELGKSLLKVCLLVAIGWWMLQSASGSMLGLVRSDIDSAIGSLGGQFVALVFAMAGGLAIIAGIDLPVQIVRHLHKLKMTKQEVKDEHKTTEGDPTAKQRLRKVRMERAQRRMMQAVPDADVVVTNPTHFAVAMKYDPETMSAPVVVAKGQDLVAFKIREIAEEHDITIMENKPLAQALYFGVDIDEEVPEEHYQAVAEIISYVWNLKGRTMPGQDAVDAGMAAVN